MENISSLRKFVDLEAMSVYETFQNSHITLKKLVDWKWIIDNTGWPLKDWIETQELYRLLNLHRSLQIHGFHLEEIKKFYSNLKVYQNSLNLILSLFVHQT